MNRKTKKRQKANNNFLANYIEKQFKENLFSKKVTITTKSEKKPYFVK